SFFSIFSLNNIIMSWNLNKVSARAMIVAGIYALGVIVIILSVTISYNWLWALPFAILLAVVATANTRQRRHTILRNYPLLGYARYLFESVRPEFRQYFFESDLDGKPFNRRQRSIVYQRA